MHKSLPLVRPLVLAAPAAAQTRPRPLKPTRVTVSVSGGAQAAASNLSEHFSLDRNLETQTVAPGRTIGIKAGGVQGGIGIRVKF